MIILDTDVLIEILDKKSEKGEQALQKIINADDAVAITSLTLHEMLYGLRKYAKTVPAELQQMDVLPFTRDDATLSAQIEVEGEQTGHVASRIDTMIAAIAVNRNATLFTFNTKHFCCIARLSLLG